MPKVISREDVTKIVTNDLQRASNPNASSQIIPEMLRHYKYWSSYPTTAEIERRSNYAPNALKTQRDLDINKTFNVVSKHLRKIGAEESQLAPFEADGLLRGNQLTFSIMDSAIPFMQELLFYTSLLTVSEPEVRKNNLATISSLTREEYNCHEGSRERMNAAIVDMMAKISNSPPEEKDLLMAHRRVVGALNIKALPKIYEGSHPHVESAIEYLCGITDETKHHSKTTAKAINAETAWQIFANYRSELNKSLLEQSQADIATAISDIESAVIENPDIDAKDAWSAVSKQAEKIGLDLNLISEERLIDKKDLKELQELLTAGSINKKEFVERLEILGGEKDSAQEDNDSDGTKVYKMIWYKSAINSAVAPNLAPKVIVEDSFTLPLPTSLFQKNAPTQIADLISSEHPLDCKVGINALIIGGHDGQLGSSPILLFDTIAELGSRSPESAKVQRTMFGTTKLSDLECGIKFLEEVATKNTGDAATDKELKDNTETILARQKFYLSSANYSQDMSTYKDYLKREKVDLVNPSILINGNCINPEEIQRSIENITRDELIADLFNIKIDRIFHNPHRIDILNLLLHSKGEELPLDALRNIAQTLVEHGAEFRDAEIINYVRSGFFLEGDGLDNGRGARIVRDSLLTFKSRQEHEDNPTKPRNGLMHLIGHDAQLLEGMIGDEPNQINSDIFTTAIDENGFDAIAYLVANGDRSNLERVENFVAPKKRGELFNDADPARGQKLLSSAVQKNRLNVVKFLTEKDDSNHQRIDLNLTETGNGYIHSALSALKKSPTQDLEIAKTLLRNGATPKPADSLALMNFAVDKQDSALIQSLIWGRHYDLSSNINAVTTNKLLQTYVEKGDLEMITALAENRADPKSLMNFALDKPNLTVMRFLVETHSLAPNPYYNLASDATITNKFLKTCAEKGDVEMIHFLTAKNDEGVAIIDPNHPALFDNVLKEGRVEILKALIAHGADSQPLTNSGVMKNAASNYNSDLIKFLIEESYYDLNLEENVEVTRQILNACSKKNDVEMMRFLTEKDADGKQKVNPNDYPDILSNALKEGRIDMAKTLVINGGATPNKKDVLPLIELSLAKEDFATMRSFITISDYRFSSTYLSYDPLENAISKACIKKEDLETIDFLTKKDVNGVSRVDPNHPKLLGPATEKGQVEVLKLLVKNGASARSLMDIAVNNEDVALMKFLVEPQPSTNKPYYDFNSKNNADVTKKFLKNRVENGDLEMIDNLTKRDGGGISIIDPNYPDLFSTAAKIGRVDIARTLVENGAVPNKEDALSLAKFASDKETSDSVRTILKGLHFDHKSDDYGINAILRSYCHNKDTKTINFLTQRDDFGNQIIDPSHLTLVNESTRVSNYEIMETLLINGANPRVLMHSSVCERNFASMKFLLTNPSVDQPYYNLNSKDNTYITEALCSFCASHGDVEMINLLTKGDGQNPKVDPTLLLHTVAGSGRLDIVTTLIENGADLTKNTAYGKEWILSILSSAEQLFAATKTGNLEQVKPLLEEIKKIGCYDQVKSAHNHYEIEGLTALHVAAREGHSEIVNFFTDNKDPYRMDPDTTDTKGMTPFVLAAQAGKTDVMQILLNNRSAGRIEPRILREIAASPEAHHQEVMQFIAENKPDLLVNIIDSPDINADLKKIALRSSIRKDQYHTARSLIDASANLDLQPNSSILVLAAERGDPVILGMIINKVKNPRNPSDLKEHLRKPLITAIENGHVSAVDLLFEKGADITNVESVSDIGSLENNNFLYHSISNQHLDMLSYLTQPSIMQRMNYHLDPNLLSHAVKENNLPAVEVLLKVGINPSSQISSTPETNPKIISEIEKYKEFNIAAKAVTQMAAINSLPTPNARTSAKSEEKLEPIVNAVHLKLVQLYEGNIQDFKNDLGIDESSNFNDPAALDIRSNINIQNIAKLVTPSISPRPSKNTFTNLKSYNTNESFVRNMKLNRDTIGKSSNSKGA